jgi:hypothetical protein
MPDMGSRFNTIFERNGTSTDSAKFKGDPMSKRKRIPDPDGQNKDRAIWAGVALAAFQSITGTDDCDAIKDLLCDLMHYCQQNGQDFDVALDAARHHHTAETTEG